MNITKLFELKTRQNAKRRYILRLFISGATPHSRRAVANVKGFCDKHLKERYDLEVVDLYQQPGVAQKEQIIAAPTLIRKFPPPLRRFIGDMSNMERILIDIGLQPTTQPR